jgi:hypothetical protein
MTKLSYDDLKKNPERILELENSLPNRIVRAGRFSLPVLNFIKIPEREVLRENMFQRYGIERIDDYYIPVILDSATYRQVTGRKIPSIFDGLDEWLKNATLREGHVKKTDGHFLAYICTNIEIDMAIEHEGIHAFMFRNNPHYSSAIPNFGSKRLVTPKAEILSWTEAVAWVATTPERNASEITERYTKDSVHEKIRNPFIRKGAILLAIPLAAGISVYNKIKEKKLDEIPYALANVGIVGFQREVGDWNSDSRIKSQWEHSFELAANLKEKMGVKEFVRLAGIKNRDQMEKLA